MDDNTGRWKAWQELSKGQVRQHPLNLVKINITVMGQPESWPSRWNTQEARGTTLAQEAKGAQNKPPELPQVSRKQRAAKPIRRHHEEAAKPRPQDSRQDKWPSFSSKLAAYKQRWLRGCCRRDSRHLTKCNMWTLLALDANKSTIKWHLWHREHTGILANFVRYNNGMVGT